MATDKPKQSLADYVTIALSPLLIMALVGSLVFFLLEILYAGQYSERLQWTLFFFVFAMVLIARIAIEQGNEKAGLYAIALGIVVFLALQAYVEYPPGTPTASIGWLINLGLMAIIWWCAHRLTWDCTYIDEKVDASGKGVLEAAGLDEAPASGEEPAAEQVEPAGNKKLPALVAWWDRYQSHREAQRKKPHTPGVWVVYFSLAALPIFGLGQSLIPVEEEERRRHAFWLMVYYVSSGLGLLATTSFLGLRRYLRQRKLKMPAAMTATWLALGGGLIAVLMLFGAVLPRPYGEYSIFKFTPIGSHERDASQYAVKRDGAGKGQGQGQASSEAAKKDQKAQSGSGAQPDDKDGAGKRSDKSGAGSSGSKKGAGQQKGGQQPGKEGDKSKSSRDDSRSEDKEKQKDQKPDAEKQADQDAQKKDAEQKDQQKSEKSQQGGGQSASRQQPPPKSAKKPSAGASSPSGAISRFMSRFSGLATFLKWVVFTVLALVVLFFVLRSGLKFLANFTSWARRLLAALQAWWASLFGAGKKKAGADPSGEELEKAARPRPFATFRNPFLDGSAAGLPPEEIVRYTFDALQSWAWERGLGREPQETPLEFAERLVREVPALEAEARGLAGLYARAAYARGRLTSGCLGTVEQFWNRLAAVEERQLSV